MLLRWCALVAVAVAASVPVAQAALRADSVVVSVPARRKLCVHEDFTQAQRKTLDVFVEKGGGLDIDIEIYGPVSEDMLAAGTYASPIFTDTVVSTDVKPDMAQAYQHEFIALYAGTYAFCLNNERSRLFSKMVQIDLIDPRDKEADKTFIADDVKASLYNLKKGLSKVQAQQKRDRHRLTLHSEANRASHNHLVFGSVVETIVFVCVSVFQIFFVRRWFQGRRTLKPWA